MASRNAYFNVRPRYTCGSPAQVNEGIAEGVARDEFAAYEQTLYGAYGEEAKRAAQTLGLSRIAESVIERRNGWEVTDLVTKETYFRPFSYKKGARAEWFDSEMGWRDVVVMEKFTTGDYMVTVALANGPAWDTFEVERSHLRDPLSVKKIEVES